MKDDIKETLEDVKRHLDYVEATKQCSIRDNEMKAMYDYITNLQTISDNRMNALLEIERYCFEEKEDLISGGEVCEDILKIIDELKGK